MRKSDRRKNIQEIPVFKMVTVPAKFNKKGELMVPEHQFKRQLHHKTKRIIHEKPTKMQRASARWYEKFT